MGTTFNEDVTISGTLYASNVTRSTLATESLKEYPLPWTGWRVWDALHTNLPGTAAADDLALVGGTFGTATPALRTGDLKAAGATTRYARAQFQLPPEYVAGQTVKVRLKAGMLTTVADTSATCDVELYESNKSAGVSADLVTTAAQSCNSLTLADKDFSVTSTDLAGGDILDLRVAMTINDAATATVVEGILSNIALLLDIRG